MRSPVGCVVFLLIGGVCSAQTIDVRPKAAPAAAALPMYRPALVGHGPGALINQIDGKALAKQGQKDGAVMFACTVTKTGGIGGVSKFRSTAEASLLEAELRKRLAAVRFVPAVYNHQAVDVIFFGTVTFAVVDGKPRLRIFSNQEKEDLAMETDFVAPQIIIGGASKFSGWHYPSASSAPVEVDGIVSATVDVSDMGALVETIILGEDPPVLGFGQQVLQDLQGAVFVPGFRGGKPAAGKSTLTVFFVGGDNLFKVPPVETLPNPQ